MMGWGRIEVDELEDGEAAYGDGDHGDHTSTDPDIAFSYIDEKLRNVLGHFQKDFEGGISAENLGAKLGGYGSFLPMYQRSPPIWSQLETPPSTQNHSTSRSPSNLPTESRGTSDSCSAHLWNNTKSSSIDCLAMQDSRVIAEKVSVQHEPSCSKSVNPPDRKKLTVRIKVGFDNEAQRNAAIYSGLGLTSPSSSTVDSPEESCGTPGGFQEMPSESPASTLQFLTSFPVPGDFPLSPLHEHVLNLIRSGKGSVDSKPASSGKVWHDISVSCAGLSPSVMRAEETSKAKNSESVRMDDNFEQTRLENEMISVDSKSPFSRKSSGNETLENGLSVPHDLNHRHLSDSVHDTSQTSKNAEAAREDFLKQPQNIPVKKREMNKDMAKDRLLGSDVVKGESLESISAQDSGKHEHQESMNGSLEKTGKLQVKSMQKGVPLNGGGKPNRLPFSVKSDSHISERKFDSTEATGHLERKCGPEVAFRGCDESGISYAKRSVSENLSFEGKMKLKRSQTNAKPTSNSDEVNFKSGVRAAVRDKKSAQKNVNKVCEKSRREDNRADLSKKPSGDKSKSSSHEDIAEKHGVSDTYKEIRGFKRFTDRVEFVISRMEPLNDDDVLPTEGKASGTELVPASPVLITEDWVGCDRCRKWRLLPYGTKPEHLPEKWMCSMLNWLNPGMNRCDITEEETTNALQALYQIPLPENQNILRNDADSQHLNEIHQNIGPHFMTHQGKKKLKSKENFQTSDNSAPIMNSNFMKNARQEVRKSGSLKDMKLPCSRANLIKEANAKHLRNPSYQEENKIKGGAKPEKRSKRERESDQYGQVSVKKFKTEGAFNVDNKPASECDGHLGKLGVSSGTGFPSKAALRNKQKQAHHRKSDRPQAWREALQGSMRSDFRDVKAHNDRTLSTKRRKLKDHPDGQDCLEIMLSKGNYFQDTKESVKEDRGFKTEKKHKVSGSQGKDLKKTKGDDKLKTGGNGTKILLPGNRTNIVDKSDEKAQQIRKYTAKVSSGITMEDLEALKKDLDSEHVSTAANSSSSKVSDSWRRRANYLAVKGSPAQSVSSSPMRTSNLSIISPPGMSCSAKNDRKLGDFRIGCSPRGSFFGDGMSESNQSGPPRKRRVCSASHPESFQNPRPEFWENNSRGQGGGALSGTRKVQLCNNDSFERHSPCPSAMHAAACYTSKERETMNHTEPMLHQRRSGIVSSRSNENNKLACFSSERKADKVSDPAGEEDTFNEKISLREDSRIKQKHHASYHDVVRISNHPLAEESSSKVFRDENNLSKRDLVKRPESGKWDGVRRQNQPKHGGIDKLDVKFGTACSVDERANGSCKLIPDSKVKATEEIILTQVKERNAKSQVNLYHDDNKGMFPTGYRSAAESQKESPLSALPRSAFVGEGLKVFKAPANAVDHNATFVSMSYDQCVVRDLSDTSHVEMETPTWNAASALEEAEKLRDSAGHLKDSGFGFECNAAYFQAALMFLLGASLLEISSSESNMDGEMSQMQIYSSTAKICEACALEYEKRQEMAAAALAYKCTEVAYMRIVYNKNSSAKRVCHDVQACLQMIPEGESPSSSVSDIDNLNQVVLDKAALDKGNDSLAGNHINGPRDHPNFVSLLDFIKDVHSALEASMKSQCAFTAAANLKLGPAQEAIISSVKRVIDFGFQDVVAFVPLVRHAIEAISRRGSGSG